MRPVYTPIASTRRLAESEGTGTAVSIVTTHTSSLQRAVAMPGTVHMEYAFAPGTPQVLELAPDPEDGWSAIQLTFSVFDVECDHDSLLVRTASDVLWQGGCTRQQPFDLTVPAPAAGSVLEVVLASDTSISGSGVTVTYEGLAGVPAASQLVLPGAAACPGSPVVCGGDTHGVCMADGTCACSPGFTGEDCSAYVLCPGPACDTLTGVESVDVAVVAPWGDDVAGTGWVGSPIEGGSVPKPFATVAKARASISSSGMVLVYPGNYQNQCGSTATGPSEEQRIVGLPWAAALTHAHTTRQSLAAVFDCEGAPFFMHLIDTRMQLGGVSIVRASDSAVRVDGGSVVLTSLDIADSTTVERGGGLRVVGQATVVMAGVVVRGCSSPQSGGGVYAGGESTLVFDTVQAEAVALSTGLLVDNCTAPVGGGLHCVDCSMLADIDQVWVLRGCVGDSGGNVAVEGASTLQGLTVELGVASQRGGGMFVHSTASVVLGNTSVTNNRVDFSSGVGGGVFLAHGSTVVASELVVANNLAAEGGGFAVESGAYLVAAQTSSVTSVHGNWACQRGGGIHVEGGCGELQGLDIVSNAVGACGHEVEAPRGYGGGLSVRGGHCAVNGVAVRRNTAACDAGGCYGGGVALEDGANISAGDGVTIDGNTVVNGEGGGLHANNSSAWRANPAASTLLANNGAHGGCGGGIALRNNASVAGLVVIGNIAEGSPSTSVVGGGGVCSVEGRTEVQACNVSLNTAEGGVGGGILAAEGSTLVLRGTVVVNNLASGGGGCAVLANASLVGPGTSIHGNVASGAAVSALAVASGRGGGLLCLGCTAVTSVSISNNTARTGGGVAVTSVGTRGVPMALSHTPVVENTAEERGGGLDIEDAHVTTQNTTVARNTAVHGGGVYVVASSLEDGRMLTDQVTLTVLGNEAVRGGGFFIERSSVGSGGDSQRPAWLLVAYNKATDGGGGAFVNATGVQGSEGLSVVAGVSFDANAALGVGGGLAVAGGGVATTLLAAATWADLVESSTPTHTLMLAHVAVQGSSARGNGGAIHVADAVLTGRHVVITNSRTTQPTSTGGGMFVDESVVALSAAAVVNCTARSGGGIMLRGGRVVSDPSATVDVRDCVAIDEGGGVASAGGIASSLVGVDVTSCIASAGGGVAISDASHLTMAAVALRECKAVTRSATSDAAQAYGGGLWVGLGSSAHVEATEVSSCTAASDGGGVFAAGHLQLSGSSLHANVAGRNGGGIAATGDVNVTLSDCSAAFNVAASSGGAVWVGDGVAADITGSTFVDNRIVPAVAGTFVYGVLSCSCDVPMCLHVSDVVCGRARHLWRRIGGDFSYCDGNEHHHVVLRQPYRCPRWWCSLRGATPVRWRFLFKLRRQRSVAVVQQRGAWLPRVARRWVCCGTCDSHAVRLSGGCHGVVLVWRRRVCIGACGAPVQHSMMGLTNPCVCVGDVQDSSVVTVTRSSVSGCQAVFDGGALYTKTSSTIHAANASFHRNTADAGAGVFVDTFASLTAAGCLFADNTASFVGGGVYANRLATVTVLDSALQGTVCVCLWAIV